jgi:NTE family protein
MFESYQKRLSHRLGLEKSGSLEKILKALVGNILIEDLPLRFGCNAVDLVTGKEVNFTRGPLYRALRASLAYPLVIEPARFARGVLIDGGLLNNVPIHLARQLGASRVLVTDVHRRLKRMPARRIDSTFILMDRLIQVILTDSTEGKLREADLIININSNVDTFDFSKIKRQVNLGKRVTLSKLNDIKKMIRPTA